MKLRFKPDKNDLFVKIGSPLFFPPISELCLKAPTEVLDVVSPLGRI